MGLLDKYFWIIIIAVIGFNLIMCRSKAKNYLYDKPELKEKTNNLYWNIFIFLCLPFLIQGIGLLTGNINSSFDYLKPETTKIFIILWYLSIILMWIKGTYWVFKKNGAEFLSEHPEILLQSIFRIKKTFSSKSIKIGWIVILVFGIWGLIAPYILGF